MKTSLYLCLFSALIIFNSCNSDETYTKYENYEFVDCYEAGNECLSLVNENKDELKEIFIREMVSFTILNILLQFLHLPLQIEGDSFFYFSTFFYIIQIQ